MNIQFTLTMPNRGSWNGRWSGESTLYAVVKGFSNSKAGRENAARVLSKGSYYYSWGDGWGANVTVKDIDGRETARVRRTSKGFCGYEWMIESIIKHGKIYGDHQIPDKKEILTPA